MMDNINNMTVESEKMKAEILRGNTDCKISLLADNHKTTVDAWDFRHIIQMDGMMPSKDDIEFDSQCFRGGSGTYNTIAKTIENVVLSDDNPWRVLKRAEYQSEKHGPLATECYARFSELMGSEYLEKPKSMNLRDYIVKLATNCKTKESEMLGILLNKNNAPAIDRWYESLDLSGLYNRCFEDRIYSEIYDMAESYADKMISDDTLNENINEFSTRLFNDIASKMDADMKSDINLRKAIQSENLLGKLRKLVFESQ